MSKKIKSPTKNKSVGNHIGLKVVTVLVLILMVAALVLPKNILSKDMDFGTSILMTLLAGIKDAFSVGGFGEVAKTITSSLKMQWFALFAAVVAAIPSVIVLLTKKASPVWFRIGSLVTSFAAAIYLFNDTKDGVTPQIFTIVFCALAVVTLLHMIVSVFGNKQKKGALPFLVTLLTIGALVVSAILTDTFESGERTVFYSFYMYAAKVYDYALKAVMHLLGKADAIAFPALDSLALKLVYASLAMAVINAAFGYLQVGNIRPNFFTVIRYFVQLGLTGAALVLMILDKNYGLVYIILAAIALVAFVLTVLAFARRGKTKGTKEEPQTAEDEAVTAEMAEIANLEEAPKAETPVEEEPTEEVVEEAKEEQEEQLTIDVPDQEEEEEEAYEDKVYRDRPQRGLGEEDFFTPSYGRKKNANAEKQAKDHFLHKLSPAARREFKEIFLGDEAPDFLPEYKVAEDNTEFFDSVFIHLGKVRKIMSDDLLGEMYDYIMQH